MGQPPEDGAEFAGLALFAAAIAAWSLDPTALSAALPKALRRKRLVCITASVLLLAIALLTKTTSVPWLLVAQVIPLATVCSGIFLAIFCAKSREEHAMVSKFGAILMWATFAFFLLTKIMLHPRFHHYGFALAAPAAIFLVVLLTSTLPGLLRGIGLRGRLFTLLIACFIVFDLAYYLLLSDEAYGRKTYPVGSGKDRMVTYDPTYDPRGPAVNRLLERIRQAVPREASLVVLPEGVMVNYLLRRANPTPYLTFMPPEFAIYGEMSMLEALQNDPPNFVVVVSKDTEEYGVGPFGKDPAYGSIMMAWVKAGYETVWQVVEGPGQPEQFGVELLRRRDP